MLCCLLKHTGLIWSRLAVWGEKQSINQVRSVSVAESAQALRSKYGFDAFDPPKWSRAQSARTDTVRVRCSPEVLQSTRTKEWKRQEIPAGWIPVVSPSPQQASRRADRRCGCRRSRRTRRESPCYVVGQRPGLAPHSSQSSDNDKSLLTQDPAVTFSFFAARRQGQGKPQTISHFLWLFAGKPSLRHCSPPSPSMASRASPLAPCASLSER